MNLKKHLSRKIAEGARSLLMLLTFLTLGFSVKAQVPAFTEILKQYYNTDNIVFNSAERSTPYGQQFGNYTFEEWETVKDGYVEPKNWNSFMTADAGSVAFIGDLSKYLKNQISQSTEIRPGSTGSYSAKIFSTATKIIVTIVANGNMTTGKIYAGSASASNDGNYNFTKRSDENFNTPLTTIPDSLTVWVAFKPKDASKGNARITTTIHGDTDLKQLAKSGDSPTNMVCATANQEIAATSTSSVVWKRVTVPFIAGSHNDPRYILTTFNTNASPGGGSEGDELYVDDICLIYNPSLEMGYLAQTEFDGTDMNIIEVPFTLDGSMSVYNLNAAANEVIAQLSDADGSFANPIELGRVTTSVSGTINGLIPAGLAEGTYKIRVVSTNYPMESNEADITIEYPYTPVPQVEIARGNFTAKSIEATFTPNADCAQYYFMIAPATETIDAAYIKANGETQTESYTKTFEGLTSNTEYTVCVLPVDVDGFNGEIKSITVTTKALVPQVEITKGDVLTYSISASFVPNADCAQYYFLISAETVDAEYVMANGELKSESCDYLWEDLMPNTNYTIYVLPIDIEGNDGAINTLVVKTRVEAGVSEVDIDVEKLSETSVVITATPNENTVLYHYIVMTKAEADEMGEDAVMQKLNENENYLTAAETYAMTVESNVAYYVVAQGKNADDKWGEITKVEFMVEYTDTTAVAELDEAMFEIYPNPASEYVRITSDVEIESLMIFSMDGKMVYSQDVNQEEIVIDVTEFAKGSYIVRMLSNDKFVLRGIIVK